MRIISDFNDYYDYGQSYGFDPHIIWSRKTKFIKNEWRLHSLQSRLMKGDKCVFPQRCILGIAGELKIAYCGTGISLDSDGNPLPYSTIGDWVFNKEQMQSWLREKCDFKYWQQRYAYHSWRKRVFRDKERSIELALRGAFELGWKVKPYHTGDPENSLPKHFETTPVFLATRDFVIEDICLQKFGLQGVDDGLQLYQKISQHFCNVRCVNQPPVPVPSDDIMVEIKGFDKRASFRHRKKSA